MKAPNEITVSVILHYDGVKTTEQHTVVLTKLVIDSLHGYIDKAVTQIKKRLK